MLLFRDGFSVLKSRLQSDLKLKTAQMQYNVFLTQGYSYCTYNIQNACSSLICICVLISTGFDLAFEWFNIATNTGVGRYIRMQINREVKSARCTAQSSNTNALRFTIYLIKQCGMYAVLRNFPAKPTGFPRIKRNLFQIRNMTRHEPLVNLCRLPQVICKRLWKDNCLFRNTTGKRTIHKLMSRGRTFLLNY